MCAAPKCFLFGWGACDDNQLGPHEQDSQQISSPQPITVPSRWTIARVACGYKHTLLLNADGEVYSCGGNEFGQLGRSDAPPDFRRITALENHTITDIACGAYHNAAISYTGRLFTWGCNSNGQLGREGDDSSVKMIRSLAEHRVVQVSLGLEHSLVLTDTSRLFVFGSNIWGQLGLGFRSDLPIVIPQQLMCLSGLPIRCISAGGVHSAVLTISGTLYVWGGNKYGQLGLEPIEMVAVESVSGSRSSIESAPQHSVSVPTAVKSLKGQRAVFVDCGESHTVVLTEEGGVFTYGGNQFGQLGHGESSKSISIPRKVADLMDNPTTQVACGRMHTLVLVPSLGCVYAFGAGSEGQLGTNTNTDSSRPMPVKGPWLRSGTSSNQSTNSPDVPLEVARLYAGGDHAYALTRKSTTKSQIVVEDFRVWDPMSSRSIATVCPQALDHLRDALTALPLPAPMYRTSSTCSESSDSTNSQHVMFASLRLETAFSSLGCLAATCLADNHFSTGRDQHGVDLDAARDLQQQLFRQLQPKNLRRLIEKLMDGVLNVARPNYPSIECLRGLMVLAVSDLLNTPRAPDRPNSHDSSHSDISAPIDKHSLSDSDWNESGEAGPFLVKLAGLPNPGMVLHGFTLAINQLEPAPSKIIDRWFARVQPRYFKKLVTNLNNHIVYILNMQPATADYERRSKEEGVRSSLELMKRLYRINESRQPPISYVSFYIPVVREKVNIDSSFLSWLRERESGGMIIWHGEPPSKDAYSSTLEIIKDYFATTTTTAPKTHFFSFCDYPFIFDAPTKARLLSLEATLSMQNAVNQAERNTLIQSVMSPLLGYPVLTSTSPFFHVTVRRDFLIQDTLTYLTVANPSELRKVLRVQFAGEEAVDEGGVMKEFFLLVMRDLLSPIYGMFRCYPESRMLWFSEFTMESDNVFLLIGILCGLAIYNSIIVDLAFPLAMFRKLLGDKPVLDDLMELDPVVGRSLQQLLDYEGQDVAETFCLTFSLDIDCFGETRHIELVENGSNIEVTHENKSLYVEKYVDYVFNKSCEAPYRAFERGFHQVCAGHALKFFRPMELQSLVVGSEVVNWNELRQNTSYQGVYWDHHPVIEWFWEVLLVEFSVEDKKRFLRFLTGCDRVPLFGFTSLRITIQPMNCGDEYLPVAHTCANLLDLPLYSSKDVLRLKLSIAIQHTEGFGLV
ncbi:hypothetical protein CRM22_006165 [Opisthorchis felineus]|uniref:HECT domain-containing protein n=1 Tax=Opisthorchis felineus TaxID=147828 RepID=A0A4S2LTR8_OPIFE|nr:hypothetical protein CRM22_006165 [Opisthorchis felineus]